MSIISSTTYKSLTCITGPMFSGKTTKLLELISTYPEKDVICFKPKIDNRYQPDKICTHDGNCIPAQPISQINEVLDKAQKHKIVAIDEVQFFNEPVRGIIIELLSNDHEVLLSGLERDYLHNRFGVLKLLEKYAGQYYRLNGNCNLCNKPSTHTFRLNNELSQIMIGESSVYESLCEKCYKKKMEL